MLVYFETHSTSQDNEVGLASGHYDVDLSITGERQAVDLGGRYFQVDLVYCSDLRRARRTAELAFTSKRCRIVQDARLRECDYGDLTRHPAALLESVRMQYVSKPFPNAKATKLFRAAWPLS